LRATFNPRWPIGSALALSEAFLVLSLVPSLPKRCRGTIGLLFCPGHASRARYYCVQVSSRVFSSINILSSLFGSTFREPFPCTVSNFLPAPRHSNLLETHLSPSFSFTSSFRVCSVCLREIRLPVSLSYLLLPGCTDPTPFKGFLISQVTFGRVHHVDHDIWKLLLYRPW